MSVPVVVYIKQSREIERQKDSGKLITSCKHVSALLNFAKLLKLKKLIIFRKFELN